MFASILQHHHAHEGHAYQKILELELSTKFVTSTIFASTFHPPGPSDRETEVKIDLMDDREVRSKQVLAALKDMNS